LTLSLSLYARPEIIRGEQCAEGAARAVHSNTVPRRPGIRIGVVVVPAHLLRGALGDDRVLSDADLELLATTAWTRLRPAA
jgi:hypothetical protein